MTKAWGLRSKHLDIMLNERDIGVYGIAVLSIFSSGISVMLILMCGIAVSSSPAVCGFSSFWRYSVKEDPSRYCGTIYLHSPV